MNYNTKKLDEIIVGRVIPHIYAFSTNTIPNYLKVGDTYRTVSSRLKEWEKHFPNLNKEYEKEAVIGENNYFRDYSVHKYLENKKGRLRLQPENVPNGVYYSNEFFKDTINDDVDDAIKDIINDFNNKSFEYSFYDLITMQQATSHFDRNQDFGLRPNQQKVVDNFYKAYKNGRTNLLMYAVMRFGKSFTSLCCAVKQKAKIVVIVSGKADVEIEWKRTAETHKYFKDYLFITSKELKRDPESISNTLKNGKKAIVFLTLQDLSGNEIKEKHEEVFTKEIDLLIVDETHFGARADEYGKVLNDYVPKEYNDIVTADEAEETYKFLKRKVTLHLSGTPYRLLMGSEFKKEDIICFCQFTDIIKAQEEWDKKWLLKDEYDDIECKTFGKKIGDVVHEWDNPYYGFPQMVRFAFNPNESTQRKLNELKQNGNTYAFSQLFRPVSIVKNDSNDHKKFVYEIEVLDLIKCIDGSKDDKNIFPFLNYKKIQEGKMCRHMVMVLPYCASCDAMEELLKKHKKEFNHLCDYEIINISGVDDIKKYKRTSDVINSIANFESENKKTITLTVQRMLTGSTVKEWDTMIYLKDTSSPQEYDQAIFRLQNQYVDTFYDKETNDVVKINLKPQTLLVDFQPNRMFYMQEKKAQIFNANIDETGNKKLKERLNYELRISPIILLNKDKLVEVEETDILEAISNYNYDRGISEEAKEISIDLAILENNTIKAIIENENEITSKAGLEKKANKGKGNNLETGEDDDDDNDSESSENNGNTSSNEDNEKTKNIRKIQNYYRRILLFAFLTKSDISSLDEILSAIVNNENKRIASNLGLSKKDLSELRHSFKNKFALSDLDYKIQDMNKLSKKIVLSNDDDVIVALKKFGKLGDSAVITKNDICYKMVNMFDDEEIKKILNSNNLFLDIASVSGEFAFALVKKFKELGFDNKNYRRKILSIPKSSICYELTRKIYEYLDLDLTCISDNNAYSFIDKYKNIDEKTTTKILKNVFQNYSKEIKMEELKMIKFDAIIGNPPYQELVSKSAGNKSLGKQLFPSFIISSIKLTNRFVSLITPSKWFTSDGQDQSFPALRTFVKENNHFVSIAHYIKNDDIFPDVNLGGVNYFLFDKEYNGNNTKFFENGSNNFVERPLFENGLDIIFSMNSMSSIVNKVISDKNYKSLTDITCGRNAFGISGKKEEVETNTSPTPFANSVEVRCAYEVIRYISKEKVTKNVQIMNSYKIFTSKGNGAAGTLDYTTPNSIIGKAYIGEKNSVCTDSLIPIGCFNNKLEAINLQKYMQTKFLRYLVGVMKTSRNIYQIVYKLVPIQDFTEESDIDWNKPIDEIDEQLYSKYGLTNEEKQCIESLIKKM